MIIAAGFVILSVVLLIITLPGILQDTSPGANPQSAAHVDALRQRAAGAAGGKAGANHAGATRKAAVRVTPYDNDSNSLWERTFHRSSLTSSPTQPNGGRAIILA